MSSFKNTLFSEVLKSTLFSSSVLILCGIPEGLILTLVYITFVYSDLPYFFGSEKSN